MTHILSAAVATGAFAAIGRGSVAEFREHRFTVTDNRNAGGYSLGRCAEWAGAP